MNYQYTYLIADLLFLAVWFALFFWRKNTRKEMVFMSFLFGFVGPIVEIIHLKDWWRPLTITGTAIGIEDFLFGFVIGGIATVIYEDIFKKKIRIRKFSKERKKIENVHFAIFFLSLLAIFFIGFFLGLNTFQGSLITLGIGILIIWFKRKDLIIDSIVTGILLTLLLFVVYSLTELITPGWVHAFWYFENVPRIIFLNAPIDDIIWYFLAGALIGPLYEFWKEGRLVKIK